MVEPAYYDISGGAVPMRPQIDPSNAPFVLRLRLADVQAPAWLNTSAMQYRLVYADAERRLSFTESRWVAPPADLLELALKRSSFVSEAGFEGDGCMLHIDLDEFIQVFDMPGSSRALIEVRAALLAPRNGKLMAQRILTQAPPAGADARSGVTGFAIAVRNLSADLNEWLAHLAHDSPLLVERCRAGGFN